MRCLFLKVVPGIFQKEKVSTEEEKFAVKM